MSDKLLHPPLVPSGAEPRLAYGPDSNGEPFAGVLDLREILAALRRHLWIVVLLTGASVGGTYFLLSRVPTQFSANALVRLRDAQTEVAGSVLQQGQARDAPQKDVDPVRSEMLVLKGRQVAGAVVDREGLRLFDSPTSAPSPLVAGAVISAPDDVARPLSVRFGAESVTVADGRRRAAAPYGRPVEMDGARFVVASRPEVAERDLAVVPRDSAVDWLSAALDAHAIEGTDAITVTITSPSPLLTIRLANAVVEEYQAANAARSREQSRRRREFLEDRLREMDESLVGAQTALGRFRDRSGLFDARDQSQVEQAGVSSAEAQRKQLAADQRIRRSLVAELQGTSSPTRTPAFQRLLASPEISANPLVAQLLTRSSQLQTRRDDALAAGRPRDHEEVRQIERQLASTDAQLVDAIRSQVAALDSHVAALGDVRQQAADERSRLSPAEAEEVRLSERVDAMRQMGNELRSELQRVLLAQAVEMGQVEIVERATIATPLGSGRLMKLLLALAFGLFTGAAIALLREHLNTGIRRRSDVEQRLRVPGLAVIPPLQLPRRWRPSFGRAPDGAPAPARANGHGSTQPSAATPPAVLPELVTVGSMRHAAADAYRVLRTQLLFARAGSMPRSVAVTSASAGEGKTTTAANLAVTLAQQGLRVLLVDCDLRTARLHTLFGLSNDRGLADLLTAQPFSVAPEGLVRDTGIERLSILTSGSAALGTAGPSELLGGARMELLLANALERYDVLVLDTPPVLPVPDATILASRADATLLVLQAGRTGQSLVQDALQQLEAVGANVIGVVLNDPDSRTTANRAHGYRYGVHANA